MFPAGSISRSLSANHRHQRPWRVCDCSEERRSLSLSPVLLRSCDFHGIPGRPTQLPPLEPCSKNRYSGVARHISAGFLPSALPPTRLVPNLRLGLLWVQCSIKCLILKRTSLRGDRVCVCVCLSLSVVRTVALSVWCCEASTARTRQMTARRMRTCAP